MPALHLGSGALAAAAALGALVYTGLVGMALWSYLACFMAEPGHVPRGWHPFQDGEVREWPTAGCCLGSAGGCCFARCFTSLRCSAAAADAAWSLIVFLAHWTRPQPQQAAAVELEAWERLAYEQQQAAAAQRGRAHLYAREWEGEAARAAVNRPRYCRKVCMLGLGWFHIWGWKGDQQLVALHQLRVSVPPLFLLPLLASISARHGSRLGRIMTA